MWSLKTKQKECLLEQLQSFADDKLSLRPVRRLLFNLSIYTLVTTLTVLAGGHFDYNQPVEQWIGPLLLQSGFLSWPAT